MIVTDDFLNKIKPKIKGVSDKYTWNLYKILSKYKNKNIEIYYRNICEYQDRELNFPQDDLSPNNVILSTRETKDDLIGDKLMITMREGKFTEFWLNNYKHNHYKITDDFFNTYFKIGRCLLDPLHYDFMRNSEDRFNENENTRICNWCGMKQVKVAEEVVKTIEYWK